MTEEKNQENEDEMKDKLSDASADDKILVDEKSMEEEPSDTGASDDKKTFEERYKRALADYQNLLKQTAREKMEFAMFANELMLKEILPVYDHLKMAIEYHTAPATLRLRGGRDSESKDEWLVGVKHVVKQFKDVLEKIGVEEIKTAGEKFDHNSMESIQNEETGDEKLDGKVAKQVKAGYTLNGKVIEAAKVVVYKVK